MKRGRLPSSELPVGESSAGFQTCFVQCFMRSRFGNLRYFAASSAVLNLSILGLMTARQ